MRTLSLIDLLIVGAVLALLIFAGTRDFGQYGSRAIPAASGAHP